MDYGELTEQLLDKLEGLIRTMVWDVANDRRWELAYDEVKAELYATLAKVARHYQDKPYEDVERLVIQSMRNRMVELARRCYNTHRVTEGVIEDLDSLLNEPSRNTRLFNYDEFVHYLSSDAELLVREVLDPGEYTCRVMELFLVRREQAGGEYWRFTITPVLMQRALRWDEERLLNAWMEIQEHLADWDSNSV